MDDVFPDETFRDHEPVGVDIVQADKLVGKLANRVANMDPLFALVEMDVAQIVRVGHVDLLVLLLAQMRIDHDGTVVTAVDEIRVVTVFLHGANDAVELPRCCRACRVEEVPTNVDL